MDVAQINVSFSHPDVVRGIHYSAEPQGQAKYIQCLVGRILDVVVDLRVGSPTFGHSSLVTLSEDVSSAVYISSGLGHGFAVLDGPAQVVYATSKVYDPAADLAINPFDSELDIPWPQESTPLVSSRDSHAPTLSEARALGLLPRWERNQTC